MMRAGVSGSHAQGVANGITRLTIVRTSTSMVAILLPANEERSANLHTVFDDVARSLISCLRWRRRRGASVTRQVCSHLSVCMPVSGWWTAVDAVGNEFDGHAVGQVNAFHGAFVLVLAAFVEAGHGIVEVGGMGKSGFVGGTDAVVFGFGMRYGCQYAFSRR